MNRIFHRVLRRHFNGAVGDDLVDVHVGLGAAAGLPDAERELIVQFPAMTSSAAGQSVSPYRRELAQVLVDQGCRLFENAEGPDNSGGMVSRPMSK